ncbi:hypothetical protein GmHk_06G016037 [Glycine max]|nr:hypothetical protein GmHk_06G016037 [Glycine max]
MKFITRQKLADAKKALNSLLYNNGVSKFSFETSMDTKVVFPIKVNQNLVSILVENHKRKLNATFGNKWYTWSFNNWSGFSSEHSTSGFEWREHSNRTNKWKNESDIEHDDDDDSCVGSCSDRTVLGLPPTGPLKIEDVKNAFQLSALKWHPDKHQGPSQAMAEEKFKLCVNAYKTLCNALSPS